MNRIKMGKTSAEQLGQFRERQMLSDSFNRRKHKQNERRRISLLRK